ncbi:MULTISPECIES: tetratricopeptide repeat protein [unclassified Streptomyces]|uniref:tetratricopeptide repeat protein n=1 Tax=unclassified Streptomyces TaxID=2593676 RepID=UPI002DD81412|nr:MULTISPECIES: tetratricopeptide repeat protein [unclassified Streptomyces]WSC37254.1 tetratricopeptide repeat protein [Streptomyces sp. NBC_01763]WSF86476.1 tetratricopeptide repeat protein [Streptomyces sp. NBC_01744]
MDVTPQQPPEPPHSDHSDPDHLDRPPPVSSLSEPCDDVPPETPPTPDREPPFGLDPESSADPPPASLHTTLRRAAFGMVAAAVLVTGAVVAVPDDGKKAAPPSVPGGVSRALAATNSGSPASLSDLKAMIGDRQSWVGTHPSDARSWAVLGTAYVEWGQRSADAAYYGRAEQALKRSLDAQPGDRGNTAALVGLAALANARHDFVTAKKWGETVRTRQPKDWTVYPVLIDAYDGLGEYTAAGKAAEKFTALRSGVPALSRTAQMYRNQGRREDALATAQHAADRATAPAEKANCLHRLGELAWERGESEKAVAQYSAALRTDPTHHPSLAGRARALAALGRTDEAQRDYRAALSRLPRPEYMLELGELYESLGLDNESLSQYTRLRKSLARADGYGVDDALLLGRFEADHGNAAAAVKLLKTEWQRRHHSAAVADALGWALHRSGDSASALQYAQKAADTGGGTALYAYHLGVIERDLREYGPARRHLEEALRTNAQFSPLAAPAARKALDALSRPSATGPRDMQPTPGPDRMAAGPGRSTHAPAGAASPAPGVH